MGNILKDFSVNNIKKGIHGYLYDFSVDYDSNDVSLLNRKSEKLNKAFSRNAHHGRTDGWDQIYRTPVGSAVGPKKMTALFTMFH